MQPTIQSACQAEMCKGRLDQNPPVVKNFGKTLPCSPDSLLEKSLNLVEIRQKQDFSAFLH